jgi:hypothetical protein
MMPDGVDVGDRVGGEGRGKGVRNGWMGAYMGRGVSIRWSGRLAKVSAVGGDGGRHTNSGRVPRAFPRLQRYC